MSTDNTSVLRAAYESFARGDVPAVLGSFDEAIVWDTPDTVRFGGTYAGPAGVGEFFSHLPENYAELAVVPERFVEQGDTVVAIGTLRGRSQSGVSFELPFAHVWTMRDGKAASFLEFFDTVKLNAYLGLTAPLEKVAANS
jgi:ketosteroid isomerase-like protein